MNPRSRHRSWARACSLGVTALYLLGALQGVACFDGPKDYRQKFKTGREDVIVSMPVDQKHLTVAKGSRAWRKVLNYLIPPPPPPSLSEYSLGGLGFTGRSGLFPKRGRPLPIPHTFPHYCQHPESSFRLGK